MHEKAGEKISGSQNALVDTFWKQKAKFKLWETLKGHGKGPGISWKFKSWIFKKCILT